MFYATGGGVQCYKNFHGRNFILFVINKIVCPWKAFQLSLMIVGKATSLPLKVALFGCATWEGFGKEHYIRLERLARDKLSSLLGT
jgi:hypothetical protein